jgi:AhpD family alkylhydroperoxidase
MRRIVWLLVAGSFLSAPALAEEQQTPPRPAGQSEETRQALADMNATLGFVPGFMKALPAGALPGAWEAAKSLVIDPKTEIDQKTKDLMGVAIAAQTPDPHLLYLQEQVAKSRGASDEEIREAVAVGALTRNWSTFLNGIQYDLARFRSETDRMTHKERQAGAEAKPTTVPAGAAKLDSPDAVYRDVEQTFGFVPDWIRAYPQAGIVGAWKEMKAIEVEPSVLSPKAKELIGLGVAAQVPCSYCTYFHTQSAKAAGASAGEIREAAALAGLARHWTTIFAAGVTDEAAFRRDVDRIVEALKTRPAGGKKGSDRG